MSVHGSLAYISQYWCVLGMYNVIMIIPLYHNCTYFLYLTADCSVKDCGVLNEASNL